MTLNAPARRVYKENFATSVSKHLKYYLHLTCRNRSKLCPSEILLEIQSKSTV